MNEKWMLLKTLERHQLMIQKSPHSILSFVFLTSFTVIAFIFSIHGFQYIIVTIVFNYPSLYYLDEITKILFQNSFKTFIVIFTRNFTSESIETFQAKQHKMLMKENCEVIAVSPVIVDSNFACYTGLRDNEIVQV